MIKMNGIYKLKKLKDKNNKIVFKSNQDESDYQVKKVIDEKTVVCENLSTNEIFVFLKQFLIDPEQPEDIYVTVESFK